MFMFKENSLRSVLAAVILGLALSGCASGATTSQPAASPTPSLVATASPAPTADVAALFLANMKAMTAARMLVSGQLQIGAASVAVTGRYDVAGRDSYSTMTATAGAAPSTTEETTWHGKTYVRGNGGAWYERPPSDSGLLNSTDITSATDVGVVTKNGRQLHQISVVGPSLKPADVGFPGTGTVSLAFFAESDGTPAIMEFTIDVVQQSGATETKTTGTLDFVFSQGISPTISAPDPIFVGFVSKKGYSVSYPSGWDTSSDSGYEFFDGPGAEQVMVDIEARHGRTATSMASDIVRQIKGIKGAKVVSNTAGALGQAPARVISFTFTHDGIAWVGTFVVAVHGSSAIWVSWKSPSGNEADDAATFAAIIDSFAFTK